MDGSTRSREQYICSSATTTNLMGVLTEPANGGKQRSKNVDQKFDVRRQQELRELLEFCLLFQQVPYMSTCRRVRFSTYRLLLLIAQLQVLWLARAARAERPNPSLRHLEAVRLNNDGVAWMNQQMTKRAEAAFSAARQKDNHLADAALNDGIALLYLEKITEAKAALQQAAELDPSNPRPWYNLGLVDRAANELNDAIASFSRAVALDPKDADSWYFEGVCYQDEKQYAPAMDAFKRALAIDPHHASSEFALARVLQRTGKRQEAREHFQQFQHLTTHKVSSALGVAYGDQGRFSTAVPVVEQLNPHPKMAVHFVARPLMRAAGQSSDAAGAVSSGGACMLDVNGDGRYDLLLMESGKSAVGVMKNNGGGRFERKSAADLGLLVHGNAVSCAVGDFDGDGRADLAVALEDRIVLFRNEGNGRFVDVTNAAGIIPRNHPRGMTFIDFDHDGDLDLLITGSPLQVGGPSNVLWRNNGNRTFTDWTTQAGLQGSGATEEVTLSDINNDRAVDVVIAGEGSAPTIYFNPREGVFRAQSIAHSALHGNSRGMAILDFNKDGWMDIAVTGSSSPGITLWKNLDGEHFERVPLSVPGAIRAWGVTAIDFDNDGWLDLAAIVETASGPHVHIFRNLGDSRFADVSHALGLDRIALKAPRGLIAADVDGDGDADLIVTSATAPPMLLRNDGGNRNHSVRLRFKGLADNKTGIGTKVEVLSAGNWQKWEIAGGEGYLSQGAPEILVGLGSAKSIDMVRMLWPTGVPQDEIDAPNTKTILYAEADRRGSSCPVVFAWDGSHYGLVTDSIGAAVVGHWFTPQRRNIPDPDEWIKVDGSQLAPENGMLSLRFTEPMEEVNYIDQLRLIAVDHPEDTEVYPDERFLDNPPFASGKTIVTRQARVPEAAWGDHGEDVLPLLADADHRFVSDFTKLPYDGFAKLHVLTLDIGTHPRQEPLRLLLTGYVDYFSASSLYAAWQAGIAPISPYIEVEMANGSWKRIDQEMGFPAGLERTIVVDLTGKVPEGSRRIRIVTNLQVYWDQLLVDNTSIVKGELHQTEIPLARARLRFHGYPQQLEGSQAGDLRYNYDKISLTGPFQRQRGSYTRYGDVTPLLTSVDNRFVVFGSGEEIAAEFSARLLPNLPLHWKRDYFFYANGYVKDMDFYDALPYTVAQLPFHGMSTYPYPEKESFPMDARSLDYQLQWNDRFETGAPSMSFRFDYQWRPSTPADTMVGVGGRDGGR